MEGIKKRPAEAGQVGGARSWLFDPAIGSALDRSRVAADVVALEAILRDQGQAIAVDLRDATRLLDVTFEANVIANLDGDHFVGESVLNFCHLMYSVVRVSKEILSDLREM
jgi:hypothetical protein